MKTNTFSGYETGSFFDEMFDRGDDWLIRPYYEKIQERLTALNRLE